MFEAATIEVILELRKFNPLAIALSSGAGFIARAFAGDPATLTSLIVDGINHRGFAFIEIMSPCPTFRPEQKRWKHGVKPWEQAATADPIEAAMRIHGDDGTSIGLVYQRELPVSQPALERSTTLAEIGEEFLI